MCANPTVSTDNHAAADNRARTDPTARSYLCSGLDHRQRPDLRRRIDAGPLCDNCGRMNTGRNWWHGIEECGNARPRRVWFGRLDRHCTSGHSRCHVRMHDHSTGRCLIECRCITSIVQKTHFIRASRLQRGHAFEEQFEFIRNPACRTRNNCKRIWSTSAKEPCVTQSCFNHLCSQPANRVQLAFPLIVLMSRRSLLGPIRKSRPCGETSASILRPDFARRHGFELSNAPTRMIATGVMNPGVSRPLCPFPSKAHYTGHGDPKDKKNLRCR